jgi:hypothetical protein
MSIATTGSHPGAIAPVALPVARVFRRRSSQFASAIQDHLGRAGISATPATGAATTGFPQIRGNSTFGDAASIHEFANFGITMTSDNR